MSRKSKIPDRWLDYTAVGDVVEGSRFLAIKTPLDNLQRFLEKEQVFNCEDAISAAEKKSGRTVGMVVDLTFTHRYYNPSAFKSRGVSHKKIKVPGQVIPPADLVEDFHAAVDKFENENSANNNLILVHCTHGLNRTGYFVCKNLINRNNLEAETAIQRFNEARGHCMERENYIQDLKCPGEQPKQHSTNHTDRGFGGGARKDEYSAYRQAMANCESGYFYLHSHPSHYGPYNRQPYPAKQSNFNTAQEPYPDKYRRHDDRGPGRPGFGHPSRGGHFSHGYHHHGGGSPGYHQTPDFSSDSFHHANGGGYYEFDDSFHRPRGSSRGRGGRGGGGYGNSNRYRTDRRRGNRNNLF